MSLINNSTISPFQALTTAWHLWKEKAFEFYGKELTCPNRPVLLHPLFLLPSAEQVKVSRLSLLSCKEDTIVI